MGDFRAAGFRVQVDTVVQDLREHFWRPGAHVICNSFGAYLFLHAQAQAQLPAYPGRVLLLWPIVGVFEDIERMQHFIPLRAEHLARLSALGRCTPPARCEVHVGELDWQSMATNVLCLAAPIGIPVTVVPGTGHMLGREYVGPLLDRWLPERGPAG